MSRILKPAYWFGETVYLKNDPEQFPRIVVEIEYKGGPENPRYHLQQAGFVTEHYGYEISEKEDTKQRLGI